MFDNLDFDSDASRSLDISCDIVLAMYAFALNVDASVSCKQIGPDECLVKHRAVMDTLCLSTISGSLVSPIGVAGPLVAKSS